MRRAVALAAAWLALVPAGVTAASQRPEHLYGPAPGWERYRQVAEASVTATLFDPQSAQIHWAGLYHKGFFKPFLQPRVEGYVACGVITARNRLGGYVGAHTFVVVIDYDRVLYSEIDSSTSGGVTSQCVQAKQDGLFAALPASAQAASTPASAGTAGAVAPAAVVTTATGVTLRAMPEGAYITAVASGSQAGAAGLKPGMVIGSVNAIPLAGMGDAMLKVIDAAGEAATLTIIGGATIRPGAKR